MEAFAIKFCVYFAMGLPVFYLLYGLWDYCNYWYGKKGKRHSDSVPPQKPGDVTPPDVHEKMWRLRQSRRR